jgi:hypothetical protein
VTYSEDYPAFAGDQTGQLLAEPDMVALSPVTSARVVETQSGYLVVLKKVDDRISLSVKRRIGTPPSSQVILTQDESIQLSRVLSDSVETIGAVRGDFFVRDVVERQPETQPAPTAPMTPAQAALSTIYGESPDSGAEDGPLDWDEVKQPWRKRKAKASSQEMASPIADTIFEEPKRELPIKMMLTVGGGIVALIAVVAVAATLLTGMNNPQTANESRETARLAAAKLEPMAADKVDKFVRNFVANMLDFNPKTYRSSQIHAMAVMNPKTMEKFWQETGFPLSRSKLMQLRKDQTIMINKIVQQPISSERTDIELSADLVTPGETEPTKIRLQLDLGLDAENQLVILEMKDASHKIAEEEAQKSNGLKGDRPESPDKSTGRDTSSKAASEDAQREAFEETELQGSDD